MRTVMGVDAGGSTTRCVWLGEDGQLLGMGRSGPGNPVSSDRAIVLTNLSEAIRGSMDEADADAPDVIMLTMAGWSYLKAFPDIDDLPRLAGVNTRLRFASDLLSGYRTGTADNDGYLLLAGTGAVGGRIEGGEITQISDGLGWLIGDEGSGMWVGREAVLAVMRAMDSRGPQTALAGPVFAELGWVPPEARRPDYDMAGLFDDVYAARRPVALSRFARMVLAAPDDPVAADILDRAADALIATWRSVQRVGMPATTVLAGGLLSQPSRLRDRVAAAIGDTVVVTDGLAGAGLLALRAIGAPADDDVRRRVVAELAAAQAVR